MDAKPLKRYGRPGYPTRLEALAHPELLGRHLPPAWGRRAEMAGTVALLLAVNGCVNQQTNGPTESQATSQCVEEQDATAPVEKTAAFVAPIFQHGDGRGTAGCLAVNPPVFLSEEEALQVIVEELGRAGVDITVTDVAMEGLPVEQDFKRFERPWEMRKTNSSGTRILTFGAPDSAGVVKPLEADGLDADEKVAFEFVSQSDYYYFGGLRSGSSVQTYDLPIVAESLAERVTQANGRVYFGTFYDPMEIPIYFHAPGTTKRTNSRENIATAARDRAKDLLREQVVDFVEWLKGQGAI